MPHSNTENRIAAAKAYMDRVWGKPVEEQEHSGEVTHRLFIRPFATEPPPGVSPKSAAH